MMIGAFECAGVFASNFLLTKLLILQGVIPDNSRYNDIKLKNIIDNIFLLLQYQKQIWADADGMMPIPLLAVAVVIMIFLAVVAFLQNENRKIKDACYVMMLITGGIFVVFLPITMLSLFWMAPRSIVPIFFFYTVLSSYTAFQGDKNVKAAALVCMGILLSGMMYFTHIYAGDIRYSNDMDKQYINMVQEKIEEYERQNNIKVEYLGFSADANIRWRWDVSGDYLWDVLPRIMTVEWAKVDAFNYYESENYLKTEVPQEYVQYFMQNDWDSPDMETQVQFDGNKCYIAIF